MGHANTEESGFCNTYSNARHSSGVIEQDNDKQIGDSQDQEQTSGAVEHDHDEGEEDDGKVLIALCHRGWRYTRAYEGGCLRADTCIIQLYRLLRVPTDSEPWFREDELMPLFVSSKGP